MISRMKREALIKYMIKNNYCSTLEFAEKLIDDGVENIGWMKVKYLGWGNFEVEEYK